MTLHYTILRCTNYIALHYNYSYTTLHYNYNYTTSRAHAPLDYTTLYYTRVHNTTVLYTTLHYTTLLYNYNNNHNYNYTTLMTLHYNYDSTTRQLQLQLQLRYTTRHPAVVGEVTAATIATTPKNTTPNTFRSISGFALPSGIHNNQPLL